MSEVEKKAPPPGKGVWGLVGRIRRRLHEFGRALLAEHSSPGRLAAAVFVGAIAGCTPLFGLHLPLCIGLAYLLRLNKVSVYAAANISVPPMIPLLGFLSVQMGERMLRGRWLAIHVEDFRRGELHALVARFFVDWIVGCLVVGAAIGAVMATVVYLIANHRRAAAADPVLRAIDEATARYRAAPRRLRMYARFKYRLDPCYRRIAPLIADHTFTVDLGTGMGMLPLVLALLPGERRVLGVDWDDRKIDAGRRAAEGLERVTLEKGDLRAFVIPPCDAITLVDVLHYYTPEVQREVLARCAAALRPGGQLLIREGDARAEQTGGGWTRFVEEMAVRVGWNRGDGRTKFRPISELCQELETLGFSVEMGVAAGKLHPGNVLIVARAPAVRTSVAVG